eukprot:scaffold20742_cov125-Isochrysis_galbana.AAC.3
MASRSAELVRRAARKNHTRLDGAHLDSGLYHDSPQCLCVPRGIRQHAPRLVRLLIPGDKEQEVGRRSHASKTRIRTADGGLRRSSGHCIHSIF